MDRGNPRQAVVPYQGFLFFRNKSLAWQFLKPQGRSIPSTHPLEKKPAVALGSLTAGFLCLALRNTQVLRSDLHSTAGGAGAADHATIVCG
jgi:hypothetical protein